MFITTIGTAVDAQNVVNRHVKPLLRHTCATVLLSRGTHPTHVQKLLGHASLQLTLDRYPHWIPSMGRHSADGTDEVLS